MVECQTVRPHVLGVRGRGAVKGLNRRTYKAGTFWQKTHTATDTLEIENDLEGNLCGL